MWRSRTRPRRPRPPRARASGGGRARDVQRDVLHQPAELVRVGDEVRLAVHLDEHTDGVVEVDVAVDQTLVRDPTDPLRDRRDALLPEQLDGLLEVAASLLQGCLQSIIPTPVGSRSSFTCSALMPLMHRPRSQGSAPSVTASCSGSISGPVAFVTSASRPACRPSARASAMTRVTSETERIASSLPGMT